MSSADPRTDRLMFAGVSALTVLAWYALPDAVRSRGVRAVLKTALLGVTGAGVALIPEVYPEARSLARRPRVDLPVPALAALAASGTAALAAGTVWAEKAVYARGERRRASGVRWAHTPLALALAGLTAAGTLVDWPGLARTLEP